jgi:hypothetical protein
VVVFAMVDLGEMENPNPLLWSMFHRSNHLIGKGLVEVIPEIDLIHVLNFRQTEQFQFIAVLGYLSGLNKFHHYEQSCRGLQYLSLDTRSTLISSVFLEIWFF